MVIICGSNENRAGKRRQNPCKRWCIHIKASDINSKRIGCFMISHTYISQTAKPEDTGTNTTTQRGILKYKWNNMESNSIKHHIFVI